MLISQMIERLNEVYAAHGDIPMVIEAANTDVVPVAYQMKVVGELSVENRDSHGMSVAFLE